MSQKERRFVSTRTAPMRVETRAEGQKTIIGYGAVFYDAADTGTEYKLASWGGYEILERIMPGAFDRAIREKDDARGLFNHDPSMLLGRVSSQTMRLSVDLKGLLYEIDAPDTQVGRDVLTSIDRGDLSGSSFAFIPRRVVWVEEESRDIRQIEDLELFDTGPVTYPAYESSTTGLRSSETKSVKEEWDYWRKHLRSSDADAVAFRMREIELQDKGLTL